MSKVLPDESSDAVYLDSGVISATELKSPPLGGFSGAVRLLKRDGHAVGHSADPSSDDLIAPARQINDLGMLDDHAVAENGVAAHDNGSAGRASVGNDDGTAASSPADDLAPVVPSSDFLSHAVPNLATSVFYAVGKRMVDILGACVGLMLFSPLMLICAVWIKLYDGGPIFFWQQRIGLRGEVFEIVKFRSMVVNAEALKAALVELNAHEDDRTFKIFNDPRVTRVGRFMRRLSLDEVPQFWNVLRGDMSLVGPRPALASEVEKYDRADLARLSVKPGLTCIWQVSGRSRLDFRQQVALDLEYIHRRSILLDLKLILMTVPAVFLGDGAA